MRMPDGSEALTIRVAATVSEVDEADWDACAGKINPFVSHAFLSALEDSGSVKAKTGWQPQHMVLQDGAQRVLAVMPQYLKSHSYGEYVFDHAWADAYERAGGQYYPKLLSAVPFTPVPGPRLLVRGGEDADAAGRALAAGMVELVRRHDVSSAHVNFVDADQAALLESMGFMIRHGHQFHWHNRGYDSFDDFLGDLASRKRKSIRKERQRIAESGITIEALNGDDIRPAHWDAFYRFYIDTYDRKWGFPYLTRAFFDILAARLANRVVLVMASVDGHFIAGALNLRGDDALFGRNWGSDVAYKFLHFEACYYQAIDFAIAHGLARVEAGTQGEHKIQRGYLPVRTQSAHWFADAGMSRAIDQFLDRERQYEAAALEALTRNSPFRQAQD